MKNYSVTITFEGCLEARNQEQAEERAQELSDCLIEAYGKATHKKWMPEELDAFVSVTEN